MNVGAVLLDMRTPGIRSRTGGSNSVVEGLGWKEAKMPCLSEKRGLHAAIGVAAAEAHVDELRDKKNEDLEAHQSQAVDITPSDSLKRLGDDASLARTQRSCCLIESRSKAVQNARAK